MSQRTVVLAEKADAMRELAHKYAESCNEQLALRADTAAALYQIASELALMNDWQRDE